ncbi:transcriptional regulator with PAS, ATPase and Fis domain [Sinobaca qinghaiensis]|uniref:Transcriptional regulator with PAS, ATPase and Fis domain n=1 Tax=Sinobaca qinghaiensis TaxID=342944 RepID=A0A419V885_9BACL|nr:sigma 54-interacting transcriptional regulator [Sinobaca qinghaiensis]RKD76267.1 transcriptional regulator with PAS, ATPase and Fis domain [Sinobaca qinghaiensis]
MIALIAGSKKTEQVLLHQLIHLLGDFLVIKSCALDEEQNPPWIGSADMFVFSSFSVRTEWEALHPALHTYGLTGTRTIDPESFSLLLKQPEGKVLLVNDDSTSIEETAESLYQLGFTHLTPVPYDPARMYYGELSTAITPGEPERCPPSISHVIDIGVRPFNMATLLNIVSFFQLPLASSISERYLQTIVQLQQHLLKQEEHTKALNAHYHELLNQMDDAILAFNKAGHITAANERMAALLNMKEETLLGRPVKNILNETPIGDFLTSSDRRKFVTINNKEYLQYKTVTSSFEGSILTIKSVEAAYEVEQAAKKAQLQVLRPQYTLDDIIARDPQMTAAKEAARKMAASSHPVLIQGETGVGKELFAHAIHYNSPVWQGPFFAVNAGAMTESLLMSELFGYEEGTFTGAQKGGRRGLFELASGGTLFLDEIGDLSPNVQGQLLRVLQEGEIRRVGGDRNISVEVRIVTATNKMLKEEVQNNMFRKDLFYRLQVLPLIIPPLRSRKEDLRLLIEEFLPADRTISSEALRVLESYSWPGNIRELKSCLAYAVTLSSGEIQPEDLPEAVHSAAMSDSLTSEHETILSALASSERKSLKQLAEEVSTLTLQQIRLRIEELHQRGFVEKGRGRMGSQITRAGLEHLSPRSESR